MIVKLVGCDDPHCESTAEPSYVSTRSHGAPHGWFTAKVASTEGSSAITVEVCSLDCISPAVAAKYQQSERGIGSVLAEK